MYAALKLRKLRSIELQEPYSNMGDATRFILLRIRLEISNAQSTLGNFPGHPASRLWHHQSIEPRQRPVEHSTTGPTANAADHWLLDRSYLRRQRLVAAASLRLGVGSRVMPVGWQKWHQAGIGLDKDHWHHPQLLIWAEIRLSASG